ncbi:MAG TPA: nucleotidyl transferase AbiEii/AbiGii toxin family protein [Roseiflexaceae bacterium]|nr:nucleotidyl transferase AbiEii/AbiGii toxin family protein [Roseiflexaceae bacterium]
MTIRPATRFLRLALRRAARGTGSSSTLYDRRTAVQPLPDLGRILGPLRWVIVGGIALRAYMPERMTLDVDILVHEHDSAAARQAFIAAGYQVTGQLTIGGFTVQRPAADEPPVDVLTRSDSWLPDALDHPARDPAGYPVLARPYLILMKLQAGRTQDLADIQRLLARTLEAERLQIRTLIEQHSPELVEDFDSLRTLADLEFGPPPDAAS